MTSINWPPKEKLKLIGGRIDRLDGPAKSSGAAKYSLDIQRPGLLYGKILGSPIAAGTLKSLDTKAAEALKGRRGDPRDDRARQADQLGRPGDRRHRRGDRGDRDRGDSPGQGRVRARQAAGGRYRSREGRGPAAHAHRWRSGEGVRGGRGDGVRPLRRGDDHALLPGAARSGLGIRRRRAQRLALDAERLGLRRSVDAGRGLGSQQDSRRLPVHGWRLRFEVWPRRVGHRVCRAGEKGRQAREDALGPRPGADDRGQSAVGICRREDRRRQGRPRHRVGFEGLGHGRHGQLRRAAVAVCVRVPEPQHLVARHPHQSRAGAGVASARSSARLRHHDGGDGRPGGQAGHRRAGVLSQEHRVRARSAARDVSRRAECCRGPDRLQAQGPSPRRQEQRPDQARPGNLAAHVGRARARQRLRRDDQPRRLGDRQHRHAGPGRRHADVRRHRGRRQFGSAARSGAGQHRQELVSGLRRIRRQHDDRRHFVVVAPRRRSRRSTSC